MLTSGLSSLNWLASHAQNPELTSPPLEQAQQNNASLQGLIDQLITAKGLVYQHPVLQFKDESCRFFAAGGWLELATFSAIQGMQSDKVPIQDTALGLEVVREKGRMAIKNELDVVALANNKLHVIECKTAKLKPGQVNQIIYKLDALKAQLGTKRTRCCLVCFYEPTEQEKVRASMAGIHIIALKENAQWTQRLKQWLLDA